MVALAVVRIAYDGSGSGGAGGAKRGADVLHARYDDLLDIVSGEAAVRNGVLQTACAGYFCVSFNAQKTCAGRGQKVLRFADAVRSAVANDKVFQHLRVTVGVASGEAMVGDYGRLSVVAGGLERRAAELQKLCETMPREVSVLAPFDLMPDLSALVSTWTYVDQAPHRNNKTGAVVPGSDRSERVVALLTVEDGCEDDNEWMYVLEQRAAASPYAALNSAWVQFFDGHSDEALKNLEEVAEPVAGTVMAASVARLNGLIAKALTPRL